MIDIAIHELNKYYGSNHVIQGVTFNINSGEKVGLLGRNGSGKTTLFKTITGEEFFEGGSISKATGKKVEMLAQIPVFKQNSTVEDILRSSFQEVTGILAQMKEIEGDGDPLVLLRYGQLMEEYERLGGYDIDVRIDKVCGGMNIDERMRKSIFNSLSGGEKTRVNLARILLRDCDILLLDEPTNHLDLASLEWLEKFLHAFSGTVVVISHDRIFLDRVVTRIVEIDDGKANFYSGNYSFYVEERERRYLTQAELYKQQQRKIHQLEAAIKRQRVWAQINPSNTGLAKRALAMEKRIEQMDTVEKPTKKRALTAEFDSGEYASKEIVCFDSVCKCYGTKVILNNSSNKILRNDLIALVGANGCGKTSLIKMIMNQEPCNSGEIKISPSVKFAYMPQIIEFENNNATILDTLRFSFGLSIEKARSILAGFHFRAEDVMKKVCNLSGGEKSRLKICMMMQSRVNFLLLDEPTNHLDIESREWIENALMDFDGTMLFVSHDRYFLNRFANKVWSMEDGVITQYDCGFNEYLELRKDKVLEQSLQKSKPQRISPVKSSNKTTLQKISVPIESQIKEAEDELSKVNERIEAEVLLNDFSKMDELHEIKHQLEGQIEALYAEWIEEGV